MSKESSEGFADYQVEKLEKPKEIEKPKEVEKPKEEPKARQPHLQALGFLLQEPRWDPATGQFVEEDLPAEAESALQCFACLALVDSLYSFSIQCPSSSWHLLAETGQMASCRFLQPFAATTTCSIAQCWWIWEEASTKYDFSRVHVYVSWGLCALDLGGNPRAKCVLGDKAPNLSKS